MHRLEGITWCDVTKAGEVVGFRSGDLMFQFYRISRCPEDLLFVRADSSHDKLAVVAQGSSGKAWLYFDTRWRELGVSFGQNCVEVNAVNDGFMLYVQIEPAHMKRMFLTLDGQIAHEEIAQIPWTSQGFLDASDPALLFTDAARRIGDVMLPQACGPYLVGQYPHDPPRVVLTDRSGSVIKLVCEALAFEPRAAYVDNQILMVSRSDHRGAVYVKSQVKDLPDFVPAQPNLPLPEVPQMTPKSLIDIAVQSGLQIDKLYPGLRERDADAWMAKVTYLASLTDARIGRKSRGPGARVSPDTIGIKTSLDSADTDPFYCVSIIRDNPPVNEWRVQPLDYGLVSGQLWIKPHPVEITPIQNPPQPPTSSSLEQRVAAIEAWIRSFRS